MNIANVITTSTGNDLPWPTNDDTGNEGAILDENTQVVEQDFTLGQNKLQAYTYSSKLVRASLALLQDTAFSLDTWLPNKLGQRIGRAVAGHLATGTGVNQPQGVTNATTGVTGAAGQVTSVTFDDLVDLEHSVDPAYRVNGEYVMNDQMLKVIRKLKDGDGRPLWVPVPAPGFPATINGFRYTIDNKMPVPAASAKSIVFGDFQAGYIVRQVLGVQVMRLTERYADYLQVGYIGFSRIDGRIDDAAALRAYAHPAA
jgi:HK97 family phage major capsid protein